MRAVKEVVNNPNQPIYSGSRVKTPLQTMATPKQQATQASSTSKNINTARIDRLFGRFGAVYGHIWQSQFKSEGFINLAKSEWAETLNVIDDNNLNLALNECKKRFEMPPTLPMFYQLCRTFQPVKPANYFTHTEVKRAAPEIAKKFLNQIQNICKTNRSCHKGD